MRTKGSIVGIYFELRILLYHFLCVALSLYASDCLDNTYTYNTIAFSWQEATSDCAARGGVLLDSENGTHLFCEDQLFQRPELQVDSTVRGIPFWISTNSSMRSPTDMCSQYNSSGKSTQSVSCSTSAPYICITGKKRAKADWSYRLETTDIT